jgi:hypothetical protein
MTSRGTPKDALGNPSVPPKVGKHGSSHWERR